MASCLKGLTRLTSGLIRRGWVEAAGLASHSPFSGKVKGVNNFWNKHKSPFFMVKVSDKAPRILYINVGERSMILGGPHPALSGPLPRPLPGERGRKE